METAKRNEEIDIVKAIGIILMVIGHLGIPFINFIYLFHMPVFFITSGYYYKENNSDTLKNVITAIIKKIKSLWFPYFIYNTIFILLNNVFLKCHFYTNDSNVLNYFPADVAQIDQYLSFKQMFIRIIEEFKFSSITNICGGFWFLRVLFFISILYTTNDYVIKKITRKKNLIVQAVISAILLLIGYHLGVNNIYTFGLDKIFTSYSLYFIGHCLFLNKDKLSISSSYIDFLLLILSFVVLLILNKNGSINLGKAKITSPTFLIISSLVGWIFVYSAAKLIKKTKIKQLFLEIGKRTITILALHILCIKNVGYAYRWYYNLPYYYISVYPNIKGRNAFWIIIDTIIGISIPLLLKIGYERIKYKISNDKKINV